MGGGERGRLGELFEPKSVAVIGASNRPGTVGESLFRNVIRAGFRGVAYPVNPRWESVSGVRCYPHVGRLPDVAELAIVIVPAPEVPAIVDELGRAGTRGVIVISSGFGEVGGEGIRRERELVAASRRHGLALVGPNCFGLLNTDPAVSLNATFSEALPPRGNIAFVSQSGALCAGILQYGIAERIGFSRFVSVGNRAGIDENDLLRSLADDAATQVILLYVESLANGRAFLDAARAVTATKPVLVIKSGRTPAGERAARSHTGSLAQSSHDQLFDALFAQSGVLRADSIGELFRAAKIFASGVGVAGPRLLIVTNSGGPGIVAADAAARQGLSLSVLPESIRHRLRAKLSPSSSISNPLDMTADAGPAQYEAALRAALPAREVDGALVIATPTGTLTAAAAESAILEARRRTKKAVAACLFGLTDLSREVGDLEGQGVPTFTFPEEAVEGLGHLARYHAWRVAPRSPPRRFPVDRARVRGAIARARRAGATVLPEYSARDLLEAYGVRFPKVARVRERSEAPRAAEAVGYPVVLKVASPDISHKTDVGGVELGIRDADQLGAAWDRMQDRLRSQAPNARIEGFEIEAQVPTGKEVLIGVQRDPGFGPVVVFGLGGVYVETLRDVTFRLAPLSAEDARAMIRSVRAYPLLEGVRGEPPSDVAALAETVERVGQMATELPQLAEMDLNPLIVRPAGEGVVAVDARVVLDPSSRSGPSPSARRSGTGRQRTPGLDAASPRRR